MRKKHIYVILVFLSSIPFVCNSQKAVSIEEDSLMLRGQINYSSKFFRDRLMHNRMESFIDNYTDFVIYQLPTQGDFDLPDQTVVSVQGNSYRWNKYYKNDFRIDDQIMPGSYLYNQDLYSNSFTINAYSSSFDFREDEKIGNSALLQYNIGDIGGVSPGTEWFFNLFHSTALQTTFAPIDNRRHIKGQGTAMIDFNLQHKDQVLHQHLYMSLGQRQLLSFDYTAVDSAYNENYIKAELSGDLPTRKDGFFNSMQYALGYSYRDQLNQEFYYNANETAVDNHYSTSVYGHRKTQNSLLTTGLTFSLHAVKHNDLNFARNHVDMDGESFEPYSPDANTFEISHSLKFQKQLDHNISLNAETYNSLIYSNPTTQNYTNDIYFESLIDPSDDSWLDETSSYYTSLYHYEWESKAFATGLLENTVGINYEKEILKHVNMQAQLNGTFDGIVLENNSIVKANWEADLFMTWTPNRFFSMGLNLSRKRAPFHYDIAKYLSNDYMNRDIYYWQDNNEDKVFQQDELGSYMTSTGGNYRSLPNNIKQPAYYIIDIPIIVTLGPKHTFTVETSYRKYCNLWQTDFDGSAEDYGYYATDDEQAYFFNDGQKVNYTINSHRPEAMDVGQSAAFLSNTPFAFVNVAKYTYNGEKAFFSVCWTSQQMINVGGLGNSPQENNIEYFSDLAANPNTKYKQLGRPHQDRAYIARLLWGYKFNEHWKGSFLFKFIDGQPFAKYNTQLKTDDNGNTQIATRRYLNNSTSWLCQDWGCREDMGFNTEIHLSYTTKIKDAALEFKVSGYNLIDFAYELTSCGFDLPDERGRNSIEICVPRGLVFSTKLSF